MVGLRLAEQRMSARYYMAWVLAVSSICFVLLVQIGLL